MNGRFQLDEALFEVAAGSGFEVFATREAPGATLADARFLERLAEVVAPFEPRVPDHLGVSESTVRTALRGVRPGRRTSMRDRCGRDPKMLDRSAKPEH